CACRAATCPCGWCASVPSTSTSGCATSSGCACTPRAPTARPTSQAVRRSLGWRRPWAIIGTVLSELLIRDVGVIEEVTLELAPGLNVLTGETGAGKTMVVSALELLLGARADADQVRAGASAAVVEGRLVPPPPGAAEWLGEGDEDLVVSREVAPASAGGSGSRSRARLGGRLAPVSALSEV